MSLASFLNFCAIRGVPESGWTVIYATCVFAVLLAWGSSYFRLLRMRVGYLTLVLKFAGFVLPYSGGTVPDSHRVLSFIFLQGTCDENKELFRAQKLLRPNLDK